MWSPTAPREGYDSWQGAPVVMPPFDAEDTPCCLEMLAATGALTRCHDLDDQAKDAANRARLSEGIAAAGRMTGPNRAEWRAMYLRRLVRKFCSLTLPDDAGRYVEEVRMMRELGIADA